MFEFLWRTFPRFFIARRNLTRAKVRSALAVLTVVIGVVAIATIGNFGMAFWESQTQNFADIGNEVQVFPGEDKDPPAFDQRDLQKIERASGGADVTPIKQSRTVIQGDDPRRVTVYGVENAEEMYEVRRGSIPANWRSGVLVGSQIAQERDLEPGDKIETSWGSYRVQAVLAPQRQGSIARSNRALVLPSRAFEGNQYTQVIVRPDSAREANATAQRIRRQFNDRKQLVRVFERSDIAESIDEFFRNFNLFLIAVGAVSLVVAGISIANVMLMSVIERREEIGVLRAVGYERLDVLSIMLAESVLLGLVGTAIGIVFSVLAAMGVNTLLLGDPLYFTTGGLGYLVGAFLFGIAVSALGGLYPAWKAARQRPVDALRS
jgi:putative ABC transport system permease protein